MAKKPNKHTKEVYQLILVADIFGISSVDIANKMDLKPHNVKVPLINLKRKKLIFSKISLALNDNGTPDGRNVKYYAMVYRRGMPLNAEQLAIVNKIRVGKKISEVGK